MNFLLALKGSKLFYSYLYVETGITFDYLENDALKTFEMRLTETNRNYYLTLKIEAFSLAKSLFLNHCF